MRNPTFDRGDVLPDGQAPKSIRTFLRTLGGVNIYGEPNLRVVLANKITQVRGGAWHDWPEGTELSDQGGIVFSEETEVRRVVMPGALGKKLVADIEMPCETFISKQQPLRVVNEMRTVLRYPSLEGWMLQQWEPASRYAPREWWERHRVPGAAHLMVLGPFPDTGRYDPFVEWLDMTEPGHPYKRQTWPEIPAVARLEEGYYRMLRSKEKAQSANPDWRKMTAMIELQEQRQFEHEKAIKENAAAYKDAISPLMGSTLEAGRAREDVANRLRAKGLEMGHCGN